MGSKLPYGYLRDQLDKHKLIIDEKVCETVRRIFSSFANGDSARHIADTLNKEGVFSPGAYYYKKTNRLNPKSNENNTWSSSTIMRLLKNEVYIGSLVEGKRSHIFKSKKRVFVPQDRWIVVKNNHPPIIDLETWEKTQKIILSNKKHRVSSNGDISLFSGLLKCVDCGSKMTFTTINRYKKTYKLYRCSRYVNHGKNTCSIHSISLDTLEKVVLDDIKRNTRLAVKDESIFRKKLFEIVNQSYSEDVDLLGKEKTKLKARIKEVDILIQRAFENRCADNLSENIFKSLMTKYSEEYEQLNNRIKEIDTIIFKSQDETKKINMWLELVKQYTDIKSLSREIVMQLIDSITVSEKYEVDGIMRQDVKIKYKFVGNLI